MTAMRCPKCRLEQMESIQAADLIVLRCPVCQGVLLEEGQLRALVSQDLARFIEDVEHHPTPDALDEARSHCYACKVDMELIRGPMDVFINWCASCGSIFLDQGELTSIRQHPSGLR
ncbi:MAG: zf-TFIIB domain-containing protein [Deltaproteobacteria bacterium]|nr:zf-TFIIB domain-containing protein [Deltaproteobacteria bacterium]